MPTIDLGSVVGPRGEQGPQGQTGAQGDAGPNLVTAETETTLTGVLAGANGVVGVRPVDSAPNSLNFTNLISSAGVATALAAKAPIASPTFTGTPLISDTPASGDNSHKIADTAFVAAGLAGKAPSGYGIGEDSPALISSSKDFDNITVGDSRAITIGGFYRWTSQSIPSNCPISAAGGLLLVPFNSGHGMVQIVFDVANDAIKYRTYAGGWKAWKTITAT